MIRVSKSLPPPNFKTLPNLKTFYLAESEIQTQAVEAKSANHISFKSILFNLKNNKNVHTHILFFLFFVFEIVYCIVAYRNGMAMSEAFNGILFVTTAIGLCVTAGFMLYYYLYLKTREEKNLFLKYFSLLPIICYAPMMYLNIWENNMVNQKIVDWLPNIFFLLGVCNINAILIIFLGYKKNRQTTMYGSLAYFFAFTGLFGGLLNMIGFPIITPGIEENQNNLQTVYKMFSNFYSHMPLAVFAIIIFTDKFTKLNLVNVIWITFYFLLCYLWGLFEFSLFGTADDGRTMHRSAMYIYEGLLGPNDYIFRWYTLFGGGIVVAFIVSLISELKFFPVNERFYKKRFNIFDTYWKSK